MHKRLSLFLSLICCLILLTPQVVFAATAATGSITGIAPMIWSFNETMVISDGTTAYNFKITNGGGTFNGQCTNTGYPIYDQPCEPGDFTLIDTGGGGGGDADTLRTRFAAAINATAIGVTATVNGTTIDLVNDTQGSAGNVAITETVGNEGFTVSGMSGGTDAEAVPEFTDTLYIAVLAAGGWYVFNRMTQKQRV